MVATVARAFAAIHEVGEHDESQPKRGDGATLCCAFELCTDLDSVQPSFKASRDARSQQLGLSEMVCVEQLYSEREGKEHCAVV